MYLNEKSKHLNEKCFAYDLVPVIDDKYEGIGRILNSSNLRHTKNASLMPIEPARRMNLPRDAISAGSYLGHIYYNTPDGFFVDGICRGELEEGEKVYVNFDNKVYVFPDGVYYDILGDAFDILHTSVSTDMHIYKRSGTNDFAAYAIDRSINLAAIFAKHKSIKVEGSQNRAFDGYFKIKGTDIFTGCIYFGRADSDFSFESECFTTISTDVPPLEGACVCQNRIFGYVHNQIYACALGDGGNWCEYYTDNGAFKLDGAVGDAFTACDCVDGQCVFFTEHNVYKLYGDGVLDYSLRMMSDLGGIKPEIGKAHAKALGHIYYICKNQLMRFSGIMSERVCTLRDKNIYKSYLVAVNDKLYIYYKTDGGIRICMLDVKSLSLYDLTVQNLTAVSGFIEHADVACIVSYGKLVAINATSGEGLSSFTRDVNICSSVEFDEIHNAHQRFTPTRLCLRGGAFDGGEVKIYCKLGTGEWREVGVIFGDEDKLWEFTLPSQKTDSLRLRLDGNGRYEIRNIYALYA